MDKDTTIFSKRIMRVREVCKLFGGISRTTLWKYAKSKEGFPQPVRFGANSVLVGWLESEINAYIDACIAERDKAL